MAYVNIERATIERALMYANLLRNSAQRCYANAYIAWLRNGAEGYEPTPKRLSKLDSNAIRATIDAMKFYEHIVS